VKRALACVALISCLLAARQGGAAGEGFECGVFEPPRSAPDIALQGSNGAPLILSKLRGRVVIMVFGFSYCQRVCPVTLARLSEVFNTLGAAGSEVQVVFVTVDPERDTPERLREFLRFFHPTFLGATGSEAQLEAIRREYGIIATKAVSANKGLGYEVHHSSSIFLIDREGKLRVLVPFGTPARAIVHDVMLLLKG
jgi:protein SCO1/2